MVSAKLRNLAMLTALLPFVIGIVSVSGCILLQPIEPIDQIIENITAREAFDLIQENKDNPDFVILDVRTPEEFLMEHIEGAINLDYYSETFREELDKLDKGKTYLMHCRSGGRSAKALTIMEELDFLQVYHMMDGILGWKAEEFPLVSSQQNE